MRFVICGPLLEGSASVLTADRNCVRLSPPDGLRRLPSLYRFGRAREGKPLHRLGLEPVAAHLNDGRILSQLLSVRPKED